jgi:hypothetical protein
VVLAVLESKNSSVRLSIRDVLVGSLFKVLFREPFIGIQLNLNALRNSEFITARHKLYRREFYRLHPPILLQLIPDYSRIPVTSCRKKSICYSAAQCGGYAFIPYVLAQDEINGVDSSSFIWCPTSPWRRPLSAKDDPPPFPLAMILLSPKNEYRVVAAFSSI